VRKRRRLQLAIGVCVNLVQKMRAVAISATVPCRELFDSTLLTRLFDVVWTVPGVRAARARRGDTSRISAIHELLGLQLEATNNAAVSKRDNFEKIVIPRPAYVFVILPLLI